MVGLDTAGLALVGVGLLMTALGTLRGMIAVSPVVAYSAGLAPEASIRAAHGDPRRVFWVRVLVAGLLVAVVGSVMVTLGQP